MPEVINTITFSSYSMPNASAAWDVGNSTPAFPTATHELEGDPVKIISGIMRKFSGSGNSVLRDKTPLTTNVVIAQITTGNLSSSSEGLMLTDANGVGWQVLITGGSTRLFNSTNGFVLGSQIGSNHAAVTINSTVRMQYTQSLDELKIIANGTTIATVNGLSSANTTWYASGLSRDAADAGAGITSLSSISVEEVAYTTTTITDPVVPTQSFTADTTGYTGITAITAEGLSATGISFTGSTATATWPDATDGGLYPDVPKLTTFTVTDGTNPSTIQSTIGIFPNSKRVQFGTVISPNEWYLGFDFAAAALPLLSGDVCYYEDVIEEIQPDSRIIIDPDLLPYTGVIRIRRAADGRTYFHNIYLAAETVLPTIDSVNTVRIGGTTSITVSGFTASVNAGTLDGKALISASSTEIVMAALNDGVAIYRPGTRTLSLTDGSQTVTADVDVLPPTGWNSYTITADYVQAINGVATTYLPVGWALGDYILYSTSPTSGKTTTVSDSGVSTNNVGVQELFLVDAVTGLATVFTITTTEGSSGSGDSYHGRFLRGSYV